MADDAPEKKDDAKADDDGKKDEEKKTPTAEELQAQLDEANKELKAYEAFPFTADDKKHAVNLRTDEGRVEARRLLAGGKHIHQFNAERKKAEEAAAAAKKDKDAPAEDDEIPAVKILAELEASDDHKSRMEEDKVYATKHQLLKALIKRSKQAAAQQTGVTPEQVEDLMALAEIKADPRFRKAAEIAGLGDVKEGTQAIFRRFNQELEKRKEQGLPTDLWADIVDPYIAKHAPKDDKKDNASDGKKDEDKSKPDTENDAEKPPDSGAGTGGGGLPRDTKMPDLKTMGDVDKFLKEERRKRTGDDFDQGDFLP